MNPQNSKKSPIHENADANITCDFGDGDISRSRSFLSNTYRRERRPTHERTKTDSHVDFFISRLFSEALAENDDIGTINGSPFDHGDNECKYYSPEHFAQNIHPTNNSLSLFCLNCRSISANWDCIHELICNLSSRGFLFDIIGLTEVF